MRTYLILGVFRAFSLSISTVSSFIVTALIIRSSGAAQFASYSLILSILTLFPFLDLGLSAVLTNGAAAGNGERLQDLIARSSRIMYLTATVLITCSLIAWPTGLWGIITSAPESSEVPAAAAISVCVLGFCLPVSQAQAILIGLGRVPVTVIAGAVRPIVVLMITWVTINLGWPALVYLTSSAMGMLAAAWIQALWLGRVEDVRVPAPVSVLARRTRLERAERKSARSMVIITAALPAIFATDQLVLSHVAPEALPEYALVNQFYMPCWALISAGGMTLWSRFARERSLGLSSSQNLTSLCAGFGGAGLALAGAMAAAAVYLGRIMSGGSIALARETLVAFALLLVAQSTCLPIGMFLTGSRGLWFQACVLSFMALANVPISVVAASRIGAAGPAVVSAALVLGIQVPTFMWLARARPNLDRGV